MARIFSINFEIISPEKAFVSVMDRGFLYGDSVYEVVRTYGKTPPFLLDRHFARLNRSAAPIGLTIPFSLEKLSKHLDLCLSKSQTIDSYIRIIVSRGEDTKFDLAIPDSLKPTVVIAVEESKTFPKEFFEKGISVALVSVRRNLRTALDPNIKTGNYLNNIIALREARMKGVVDALMLNYEGNVTEATNSNVFIVKDKKICTPSVESGILEGVSRGLLIEAIQREGFPFEEREISEKELRSADEVFITSTLKEVMPVVRVGEKPVGDGKPGPMTSQMRNLFHQEVDRILGKRKG